MTLSSRPHQVYIKINRVIALNDSFVEFRSTGSLTLLLRLKQLPTRTVIILAANILSLYLQLYTECAGGPCFERTLSA